MTADPTELAETRALLRRERRLYADLKWHALRLAGFVLEPARTIANHGDSIWVRKLLEESASLMRMVIRDRHPKVRRRPVRRSRG